MFKPVLKNMVDRFSNPERVTEDTPKMVYVHVPKCGGTSLIIALKQAYQESSFQSFDYIPTYNATREMQVSWEPLEWLESWFRVRSMFMYKYILQDRGFIYGHLPLSKPAIDEGQRRGYRFFTVLRDPVERFISNYVYDKTGPGIRIPDVLPNESSTPESELASFLTTPEARWMANEQLLMIAGFSEKNIDLNSETISERATKNANVLDVIGWTEDIPQFARDFDNVFGKTLSIERHNTTKAWIENEKLKPADYKALFDAPTRSIISGLASREYQWLSGLNK